MSDCFFRNLFDTLVKFHDCILFAFKILIYAVIIIYRHDTLEVKSCFRRAESYFVDKRLISFRKLVDAVTVRHIVDSDKQKNFSGFSFDNLLQPFLHSGHDVGSYSPVLDILPFEQFFEVPSVGNGITQKYNVVFSDGKVIEQRYSLLPVFVGL